MKRVLTIIIMLIIISHNYSVAQTKIYNSHFFNENVKVEYQPTLDSLISYDDAGNDLIWDYSKLPPKGESYKREIKLSENTPHSHMFPESNFAIEGQDKDYVYLNVKSSKTEFIGFVPPDSSYVVHNYQPWSISIHPLKYKDTIQSPISRYIKIGDRVVYRAGNVITTAIGEGKLILPHREFKDVLKIKEVQTFFNPTKTTFYKATTYHWLSNECNFPIMSCNIIIDRNSKGEEQITTFAQFIVAEHNTNSNEVIIDIEREKPAPSIE